MLLISVTQSSCLAPCWTSRVIEQEGAPGLNRGGMRNYGPAGYRWELWHEGPVRDRENVVLVHGYRLPLSALPGRCDEQLAIDSWAGDNRLQRWQFEYGAVRDVRQRGSYASRLDAANRIPRSAKQPMLHRYPWGTIARQTLPWAETCVTSCHAGDAPHGEMRLSRSAFRARSFYRAGIEIRPTAAL
jgi:hypothetical protein